MAAWACSHVAVARGNPPGSVSSTRALRTRAAGPAASASGKSVPDTSQTRSALPPAPRAASASLAAVAYRSPPAMRVTSRPVTRAWPATSSWMRASNLPLLIAPTLNPKPRRMPRMLSRLATLSSERIGKFIVLGVWIALLVVLFPSAGKFESAQKNEASSFLPGDAESTKALTATEDLQGGELAPAVIVYERRSGLTPADRQKIHHELERVRADLHRLVACAITADLRRRTDGTRWTNGQMLWHMAFGYLIVRRLLIMSGRTVFTKFRRHEEFEGMPLDRLRSNPAVMGEGEPGVAEAVKKAIEQVDRIRSEPGRQPGLSGLNAARA